MESSDGELEGELDGESDGLAASLVGELTGMRSANDALPIIPAMAGTSAIARPAMRYLMRCMGVLLWFKCVSRGRSTTSGRSGRLGYGRQPTRRHCQACWQCGARR